MFTALVSQLAYYVPSLLVHLLAFGVAAALFTRARLAAGLLAGGTALQLVASLISLAAYTWSLTAMQEEGMAMSSVSMITSILGLVAALVRAVGEVTVVAAFVAAVVRAPTPPATQDPYGFPPAS